jgi:hypothetical protein
MPGFDDELRGDRAFISPRWLDELQARLRDRAEGLGDLRGLTMPEQDRAHADIQLMQSCIYAILKLREMVK